MLAGVILRNLGPRICRQDADKRVSWFPQIAY